MIYARRRVVASNISLASYPRCRPTADVASCRRYCHLTRFSSRVGIAQLIPTHHFCLSVRHELVLCYKSSAVAEMGDRLTAIVVGRKVGGGCGATFRGAGFHLTQIGLGRGLPQYQVASWSTHSFGHNSSVLFLSLPRSEGWPHHGRTFSIYLYPLSF